MVRFESVHLLMDMSVVVLSSMGMMCFFFNGRVTNVVLWFLVRTGP